MVRVRKSALWARSDSRGGRRGRVTQRAPHEIGAASHARLTTLSKRTLAWHCAAAALLCCLASPAGAQDRPFLFSVAAAPEPGAPALRVDYDIGAGESVFQSSRATQPEQRIGVHASHGRFTLVGRVGLVSAGSAYQSAQAGEVLVSLTDPSRRHVSFAAGGGVLHEAEGTTVLLVRVTGARETDTWRLHGNVLIQKPFDSARDATDLITSVGWARRLTRAVALGVEGVAEDLEGFWDPAEAEGGARLLAGPSLHVAPPGRRWQVTVTGGPTFHPSDTGRASDALRDLPPTTRRVGYAIKTGFTYRVF